jgi:peptide/nickel transport system permease protein
VFALPGLGRYTIDAITNRDFPVLQGVVPLTVAIAVVLGLLAEVAQRALNPRLRVEAAR